MKCLHMIITPLLAATTSIALFSPASAQSWTAVTNRTGRTCSGPPILLSDGSIAVDGYDATLGFPGNQWNKLTPDIHGSYVNGTWTALANMQNTRADFSAQLLKDGRLYVAGGEYGTGGSTAEVYNPLTNTWTYTSASGFSGNIIDANSEILSDGTVLQASVGDNGSRGTKIYNPSTNTWSADILSLHSSDEAAYVKLPDGSILMVDFGATTSERFIPSLGSWIVDANVPVTLYDAAGEVGGAYLLPNGKVFYVGATGHTTIYTPSGNNNPGSWTAGPDLPDATGQKDAAGCMMSTGNVLLAASPLSSSEYGGPTNFYEYNYQTNAYTRVVAPGGGTSISSACFQTYMCALPNGKVLLGLYEVSDQYWEYTPIGFGSVVSSGVPSISQVTQNSCGNYTLSGTLFGGISEGAGYGDDAQSFSNYPIVKLTSGTNVYFARTSNWSTRDVQQGSKATTAQFTLPSGLPTGTYSMSVSVNGISSSTINLSTSCTGTVVLNPNTYYKIVNRASGKVLDVKNSSTADNANIVQNSYTAITSQQWRVIDSSNGYYNIVNRNSGKELDDPSGNLNDGTDMVQYTPNGGANHTWHVIDNGDGYYSVVNKLSVKYLDDSASSQQNGTNIIQWTGNGATNQEWQFVDLGIAAPHKATATAVQATADPLAKLDVTAEPQLMPNPATGSTSVTVTVQSATRVVINVFAPDGKLILSRREQAAAGLNRFTLDISNYAPGMYFVEINTGEKRVTKKLIIQK